MRRAGILKGIAVLVWALAGLLAASAQDIRVHGVPPAPDGTTAPPPVPTQELVVATRILPPFVIDDGKGELGGFSVELWKAIAEEAGIKYRLQPYPTLPALLDAVRTGTNPVGIAAVSITAERALVLDFSLPMFRSGLSILVPQGGRSTLATFMGYLSRDTLTVFGAFVLLLLLSAHIFWFLRRGRPEGEWRVPLGYGRGLTETLSWSAEAMIGLGSRPASAAGRGLAIAWKVGGILLVAYLTALLATTLTVSSLKGGIEGPSDLIGRRVATVSGSTSSRYLRELKADPLDFDTFEQAVAYMLEGKAVAAVYDTPMILFYARHAGLGRVRVAGMPFRTEDYGIIFPAGSELRRTVNAAMLRITENGTYQAIFDRWFGAEGAR